MPSQLIQNIQTEISNENTRHSHVMQNLKSALEQAKNSESFKREQEKRRRGIQGYSNNEIIEGLNEILDCSK